MTNGNHEGSVILTEAGRNFCVSELSSKPSESAGAVEALSSRESVRRDGVEGVCEGIIRGEEMSGCGD